MARNSSPPCAQRTFSTSARAVAYANSVQRWHKVPATDFTEHWPGYMTAIEPYRFKDVPDALYHEYVQRSGSRQADYDYQGFLVGYFLNTLTY